MSPHLTSEDPARSRSRFLCVVQLVIVPPKLGQSHSHDHVRSTGSARDFTREQPTLNYSIPSNCSLDILHRNFLALFWHVLPDNASHIQKSKVLVTKICSTVVVWSHTDRWWLTMDLFFMVNITNCIFRLPGLCFHATENRHKEIWIWDDPRD